MKICIPFVAFLPLLPAFVDGSLRGESSTKKVTRRLMDEHTMQTVAEETEEASTTTGECRDIPIRVRDDNSQVNFAQLYTAIYGWGEEFDKLDGKRLCDKFKSAYASLTDCSNINGSFRQIGECEMVKDAVGPSTDDANAGAALLKLTYYANVVNGAMLYHHDDPDPSCFCDRCPGLDPFPGIYSANDAGPICTCYCDIFSEDLSNAACTCRSPTISTLIDALNVEFEMESDKYYFLDARQLAIDEGCMNPTKITTFDTTYLCPGEEDKDLEELFTDFPSASPSQELSEA